MIDVKDIRPCQQGPVQPLAGLFEQKIVARVIVEPQGFWSLTFYLPAMEE